MSGETKKALNAKEEAALKAQESQNIDAAGTTIADQSRAKAAAKAQASMNTAMRNTERNFQNIQQCLLCENVDMVKNYHRQNASLFKYQTFRQINGDGHEIVTQLRGLSHMEEFLSIRTSVLSLLQPKIRIYKVYYEEKQRNPGQKGSPVPTRSPIYREIKFSDNFGKEVASSASEYLKYSSTLPNWRNVGLKQFTLTHNGRNFGWMDPNVSCQMVIYSKSLKDLAADASGQGCVQPVNPSPGQECPVRYVDLLIYPQPSKTRDVEPIDPKHYDVKAFIGYNKPPDSAIKNIALTPSERRFLEKIEKFNLTVSLTMVQYDFDIAETGEVTTTINFRARLETSLDTGTNVFGNSVIVKDGKGTKIVHKNVPGSSVKALANLRNLLGKMAETKMNPDSTDKPIEDLADILLENKLFQDLYKKGFSKTIKKDTSVQDVLDEIMTKAGRAKMSGLIHRQNAGLKNEVWKSFMMQLIDGSGVEGDTRLFAISVNKENMDDALGIMQDEVMKELSGEKSASKARRKEIKRETSNAIGLASQTVRIGRPADISDTKKSIEAVESRAQENVSNVEAEQTGQEAPPEEVLAEAYASLISTKSKGDRYEFNFLYIGDIIELAAKNAGMFSVLKDEDPVYNVQSYNRKEYGTDYGLTNVRFLLGPMEYKSSDGKIQRINIAEFPVSYDLFRAWFLEKVVRADRKQMSFKAFIQSLILNLVSTAGMGAACTNPIKLKNVRFQNLLMTLPGISSGVPNNSKETSFTTEELLPLKRKISVNDPALRTYSRKLQEPMTPDSMIKNSYDYQLIQTTSGKGSIGRSGNCSEDIKDGIYHFNIGSDKGLLKSMRFSKVQISGLQEQAAARQVHSGARSIEQLHAMYFNCELDLVGNTLFTPGMYFFANPTFLGLGNPHQAGTLSNILNLGGYYHILETKLDITPGRFTTTLVGKFEGMGRVKG